MNDDSIVLKLTYDNISFLFTGDASQNVEKEILDKNLESTVLKVGHHGSKYSSSAQFLRKVNPNVDNNIFKSLDNINLNWVLVTKSVGKYKSFLEDYNKNI